MNKNEVYIAFEMLLEEIEAVVNNLNDQGAKALKAGNYETARQALETATRLTEFRERVKALQKEWDHIFAAVARPARRGRRKKQPRLPRGLRTSVEAFRRPILEALVELGGRAPMNEVLDLVEKKMKGTLNQYDFEPLSSGEIRWRNTAQWCRNTLVQEDLMRRDSPRGIWEISEEGRKQLHQRR